jgi:hypothetical protein
MAIRKSVFDPSYLYKLSNTDSVQNRHLFKFINLRQVNLYQKKITSEKVEKRLVIRKIFQSLSKFIIFRMNKNNKPIFPLLRIFYLACFLMVATFVPVSVLEIVKDFMLTLMY